MLDLEYTEPEFQEMELEAAACSAIAAERQYAEEIEYQTALAISYPRDANALFAMNWLKTQQIW